MITFPVIKITLEGMRQTIANAFTEYLAEQDKYVQSALKEAVANFDIKKAINDEISSQFPHILKSVVDDALRKAVWDNPQLRQQLTDALARGLSGVVLR